VNAVNDHLLKRAKQGKKAQKRAKPVGPGEVVDVREGSVGGSQSTTVNKASMR
jgi:hypothetical protein